MSDIDFSVLEEFCDLLGEDGKQEANELVQLYLDDTPSQFELMEKSLASQDMESFIRAAHSFKSSSGSVGANELSQLAQQMESIGPSGSVSELTHLLTSTKTQFNQIQGQLAEWMKKSS